MTVMRDKADENRNAENLVLRFLYPLSIFLLALIPRALNLQRFVTADEAKWVYRSAQFWLAFLRGDWAGTMVKLKPAVTTMWSGGVGLWGYNAFHRQLPFDAFLAAVPEWRVDPAMLQAARMPTVILSSLSIVLIFCLLRSLVGQRAAFLAGGLLALDPFFLAHSRFLHHDALVTIFAVPSLLLAIQSTQGGWKPLLFSAMLAGLAFLTKSPIFFLAPFVAALFLGTAWYAGKQRGTAPVLLRRAIGRFALWGGIAYLVFVVLWPAAWVDPVGAPLAVILDALKEAAPPATADSFIKLGIFYYPVHFVFYLSPVVMLGILAWLWQFKRLSPVARYTTGVLAAFAITFIVFMTLSDKRSARYILPAFLPAAILAGSGFSAWLALRPRNIRLWATLALLTTQLLFVVLYAPYYITYTNPLLGGPLTAPRLIKIGWGEGMDKVGAWLNRQPDAAALTVGANYASTLKPFFAGRVVSPQSANLDYVVSYIKQRQSGSPPPEVTAYYDEVVGAAEKIRLAGIDYARIYPGPAAQLAESVDGLIAFRPSAGFAPVGGTWAVDLIWRDETFAFSWPKLSLQGEKTVTGQSANWSYKAQNWVVTRYLFSLPESTPPGDYTLYLDETPLGNVSLRYAHLPAGFTPVEANFGGEIALRGYRVTQNDKTATLDLAFAAAPKAWADYTVYVHIIDAQGNRLTGHDAQPSPPTTRWRKGEVVIDRHPLTLPPNLPAGHYRIRVGLYRADTGEALGESYVLPY